MLARGMDVKVARMEGGKDPADIIKANLTDFKHFIGNAVHVVEFLLAVLKEGMKDERTYKLRVREEILPLLITMENRIDREHFEGVIAEHIDSTREGVHYEVERLETLHTNEIKSEKERERHASPVAHKEMLVSNRQAGLYTHLCALMHVCVAERAWIGSFIVGHMKSILSPDAFIAFMEAEVTPHIQAEIFTLEEHLEGLREKYFLEEVSDVLTQYTHTMARGHLGSLRKQLGALEAGADDAKELAILTEMKTAEKLLQSPVIIQKQ